MNILINIIITINRNCGISSLGIVRNLQAPGGSTSGVIKKLKNMNIQKLTEAFSENGIDCVMKNESTILLGGEEIVFLSKNLVRTGSNILRYSTIGDLLKLLKNSWILDLEAEKINSVYKSYRKLNKN